jgi:hypothetical protein
VAPAASEKQRPAIVSRLEQGDGEIRCEREAGLVMLGQERARPSQERAAGVEVATVEGAAARRFEMLGCAAGNTVQRRIGAFELGAITVRLFEVVADDLVALDEIVLLEPVGETLVELGSGRLRQ